MDQYWLLNKDGFNCGVKPVMADSFMEAFKKFKKIASGGGWYITNGFMATRCDINLNAPYRKIFKDDRGDIIEYNK